MSDLAARALLADRSELDSVDPVVVARFVDPFSTMPASELTAGERRAVIAAFLASGESRNRITARLGISWRTYNQIMGWPT